MLKALHILAGLLLLACTSTYSFAAEEGGAKAEEGKTATAKTETFKLTVTGMTCGGCASKVSKGLNGCEGVTKATVDQKTDSAIVEVKAGTDIAKVIKAVEDAGFKAKKQEEKKKEVVK